MHLSNEDIVTKLLSEKEIIKDNQKLSIFPYALYNLGDFLEKEKNAPSVYDRRYKFIR